MGLFTVFNTITRGVSSGFHSARRAVGNVAHTIARPIIRATHRVTSTVHNIGSGIYNTGAYVVSSGKSMVRTIANTPHFVATNVHTVYTDPKAGASNIVAIPSKVISATEHAVINGENKLAGILGNPLLWLAGGLGAVMLLKK
jgi:phage-related protein